MVRSLKYFVLLAALVLPATYSQAQVSIGVGVQFGPPPVCEWGYYPYAPYACAPYGYWGPEWFADGIFIGAGPWYHYYYLHPEFFIGFRRFHDFDRFDHRFARFDRDRRFEGRFDRDRDFDHDRFRHFSGGHGFRGESRFRGGESFHGGGVSGFRGGGNFRGGSSFHSGGSLHGGGGGRGGGSHGGGHSGGHR